MHTIRTRFGKEIVAEFLPPRRKSRAALILLPGMPSSSSQKELMEFFSAKGFWVFAPRYRGTWESGGKFLKHSPDEDVKIVLDHLPRGFKDAWSGKRYHLTPTRTILIGSSFGGTVALLASRDKRVSCAVALSPVTDWRVESKTEPLRMLARVTEDAFGEGYRPAKGGWQKIKTGNFFNPATIRPKIRGEKVLILHAADDRIAPLSPVRKFAVDAGAVLFVQKRGGHYSLSEIMRPRFLKLFKQFVFKKK